MEKAAVPTTQGDGLMRAKVVRQRSGLAAFLGGSLAATDAQGETPLHPVSHELMQTGRPKGSYRRSIKHSSLARPPRATVPHSDRRPPHRSGQVPSARCRLHSCGAMSHRGSFKKRTSSALAAEGEAAVEALPVQPKSHQSNPPTTHRVNRAGELSACQANEKHTRAGNTTHRVRCRAQWYES